MLGVCSAQNSTVVDRWVREAVGEIRELLAFDGRVFEKGEGCVRRRTADSSLPAGELYHLIGCLLHSGFRSDQWRRPGLLIPSGMCHKHVYIG